MTSPSPRGPLEQSFIDGYRSVSARLHGYAAKRFVPRPRLTMTAIEEALPVVCRPYSSKAKEIIAQTAAKHDLTVSEIMGKDRAYRVSRPRQEAMARVFEATGWSYPKVAKAFGVDHTSVIKAVRRHAERVGTLHVQ